MDALLSRLQLRHYRLIRAVARHGQISLAAEALAMTQPAASRALAEVERAVGEKLFVREPKGMRPTPLGEVLARRAAALLRELEETAAEVDAFRAGRAGEVRVGAVTGAAVASVVPAVQRLKQGARDAEVHVEVTNTQALMTGLTEGEFDFVLCRLPPEFDARRFDVMRGRVEVVEFLVRRGHPLLDQPAPLSLVDLAGYGWVIQAPGTPMREAVEGAFLAQEISPPREIVNTTSLLVMIAYLQISDAISPISHDMAQLLRTADAGGMSTLRVRPSIIIPPYLLIRRKDRPLNPVAQRLLDLVFEAMTFR
ncbi:LysR substrate-binding domain-containing protein [Rhodovulum sp. DZ06]|uniref:LysR substrate-binding domain-containing protein n=1 Tax=Rhodovulum sp. DZ06 TaxID=3425126 RepID=UPI003D33DC60